MTLIPQTCAAPHILHLCKDYKIEWQYKTLKGEINVKALDRDHAYIIASYQLSEMALKKGHQYMNITITEVETNPTPT